MTSQAVSIVNVASLTAPGFARLRNGVRREAQLTIVVGKEAWEQSDH